MGRLIKFLIYILIIGFLALIAYAYVGPFFGVDFSAPQVEVRQPVVLNAD